MSALIRIAVAVRNAMMAELRDAIDAASSAPGTLKIYSGAMPAAPEDAIGGGNVLLATLTFSDPVGAVMGGALVFDTVIEDSSADATETAAWGRVQDGDGNVVFDANLGVTVGLFVITINTTAIAAGGPVRITSGIISLPASISF